MRKKTTSCAEMPTWLFCAFSAVFMMSAQASFWLVAGPGHCLIPASLFCALALAFASHNDAEDTCDGSALPLWTGTAGSAFAFTLMAAICAYLISWWLVICCVLGGFLSWGSCKKASDNLYLPPHFGWCHAMEIIPGEFRYPALIALVVALLWHATPIAMVVGGFSALMTIKTAACPWFLGGTVLSGALFFALTASIVHCAKSRSRHTTPSVDLEKMGFVKIPRRGD